MRKEMREVTIYDFPKTKTFAKKAGNVLANLGTIAWSYIKPYVKKAVQKCIKWLHKRISKLEKYLLDKIDEVVIEIPE